LRFSGIAVIVRWLLIIPILALSLAPAIADSREVPARGAMLAQVSPPPISAAAALVVDLTTGLQIYASNADTPLPPASTMKIVTALVASSILPLDEQLTVQEGDILDPTVFSNMQLQAGDVVSVKTLLHGVLIPSGADAAMVLAREAGNRLEPGTPDPVGRFVTEMNAWSADQGMSNSHFTNPVGTDDPNHYASARDLVRATQALLNDWLLARIVAMDMYVADIGGPNARQVELFNSNQLIARDDVFGIKTGTEEVAGQCLITGFWRGDNQIITVVLGSADRYADTQAVMDAVDGSYRWLALGIGAVSQGAPDALAAQGLTFMNRRTVLMTPAQAEQITWEIVLDSEPRGDRRGEVVFRLDERVVARMSIYSASSGAIEPDAA
jgi:D-alanyl-D-alanine carboxypeptidase (penicillin-binding protein 5/6)